MFKKTRNFKRIAVLLAAAIAVSPVAVPVYAEDIAEIEEYTEAETPVASNEEVSDNNTSVQSVTIKGRNEASDEVLQLISNKLHEVEVTGNGSWTSESGQNGYLIDLSYNSSGIVSELSDIKDNLDVHVTYDADSNVVTISQAITSDPAPGVGTTTVAYTSERGWSVVANILPAVKNAVGITGETLVDIIFEEGITEIGDHYFDKNKTALTASLRSMTFPESCVRFDEAACYNMPFSPNGDYYKNISITFKSDKIESIGKQAFLAHPIYEWTNDKPITAFPLFYMPKQTGNCHIDVRAFGGAICNYHVNIGKDIFKKYTNAPDLTTASQNAAFITNATLASQSLESSPVVILDKNISYDDSMGKYDSPFVYYGNIVIFTGDNPLTKLNVRSLGGEVIWFYPSSSKSTYTGNGFDQAALEKIGGFAYDCSLDELCENLETYYQKAKDGSLSNLGDYKKSTISYNGYVIDTVSSIQYTGKKINLADIISVTTPNGNTYSGKQIKVKYKNNKNAGTATYYIRGVKGNKEDNKAIKSELSGTAFTFEITPRELYNDNIFFKGRNSKLTFVKWIDRKGKKRSVPKKMWSTSGTTITFTGNFTGTADGSLYLVSENSAK